eukprot:c38313_g1_i1.p1 GENE.c38313_g1_i1~~c38313_g1_i1.p1  ORF type:complete len:168 (+),score=76.28 c38313_g1_i1:2-505(+)
MMKLMLGLVFIARVASSTVDRFVSNLGVGVPSQQNIFYLYEIVRNIEQGLPNDIVRKFDKEVTEKIQNTNSTSMSENEIKEFKEMGSQMYFEVKKVLDVCCKDWKSILHSKMKRVVGEDGCLYWVSLENLSKFNSTEASAQRMLALQNETTNGLMAQYKKLIEEQRT